MEETRNQDDRLSAILSILRRHVKTCTIMGGGPESPKGVLIHNLSSRGREEIYDALQALVIEEYPLPDLVRQIEEERGKAAKLSAALEEIRETMAAVDEHPDYDLDNDGRFCLNVASRALDGWKGGQ